MKLGEITVDVVLSPESERTLARIESAAAAAKAIGLHAPDERRVLREAGLYSRDMILSLKLDGYSQLANAIEQLNFPKDPTS